MCVHSLTVTVSALSSLWRQTGKSLALCSCVKCEQSRGWCVSAGDRDKHWRERGRASGCGGPCGSTALLPDEPGSFQERPQVLFAYLQLAHDFWWGIISAAEISHGLTSSWASWVARTHTDTLSAGRVHSWGGSANRSTQSECHILWNVNCDKAEEGD